MKKKLMFGFLIVFLSLPLVWPLLQSGFFTTHDGLWAVVRQGAMHRALMAGHFPVRWAGSLNFGYGYPLFLFTYPLPYYLGEIFNLLGFGLVGSVKLLFALSVFFSGMGMFWLGKRLWGNWGGLLSSVLYLYAPFRLVDLYVRGSLGESLAFVFYPWLLLAFLEISQGKKIWMVWGALLSGGLILTHNVSALLFFPFLMVFLIFEISRLSKSKKLIAGRNSLIAIILGFGLAAFFLLPALLEKGNIALSQMSLADTSRHFVSLKQLVLPSWGYGNPGEQNAFSFQLGWVHLLGLGVGIMLWLKGKHRKESYRFAFLIGSLLALLMLALPISFLFWRYMPLFSEIDFPWRVLGPASFFLALGIGYLGLKKRYWPLLLGLIGLVVAVNVGYAKPQGRINYPDNFYLTNEATTTSADELMPIWVKEKPIERAENRVEIVTGEGEISELAFNNQKITFRVNLRNDSEVQINSVYFPGWHLRANEEMVAIQPSEETGLIRFWLPEGNNQVLAEFKKTPLRLVADIMSLASLLALGGVFWAAKKKKA